MTDTDIERTTAPLSRGNPSTHAAWCTADGVRRGDGADRFRQHVPFPFFRPPRLRPAVDSHPRADCHARADQAG